MKTFTYPQKKWVMAGALVMALGFNLPFDSNQATPESSADFASTLAEGIVHGKIYTPKGVVPVKYIDNGEDKVLAIIPKTMTEGQICDNCGYESISLSVRNKSDIDALNVALLQAIQQTENSKLPETQVASNIEVPEAPVAADPFESILRACSRNQERLQKLDCHSDRFTRLLSRKNSNISAADAMDFYQRHIENHIRAELTEARQLINRTRRASMNMSQWQALQDSEDMFKNPSEMREETLKVIRGLISEIPSQYEDIRKRLISSEILIATEEAREVEQTFKQARDSQNPSEGVYLFKEAELRRQDLQALIQDMGYHTNAGLNKASSSDIINRSLQTQYEKFFTDFATKMQSGMWTNPYDFTGGTVSPLPSVPNLDARIRNPGRGAPIQGGSVNSRSSGRGNLTNFSTPTGQGAGIHIQGQSTDLRQTPTPQEVFTNNGVSFGTVGPATPEALQQRQIIRGRQ